VVTTSDHDKAPERMLLRSYSIKLSRSMVVTGAIMIYRFFTGQQSLTPSRTDKSSHDRDEQIKDEYIQDLEENRALWKRLFTDTKIQTQKDIRQLQDEILELMKKLDWKDSLLEEEKREGAENTTALRQEIDSLKAELATAYTEVRAMNTRLHVSEGLWKSVKGQRMAAEEKLERVEREWSQLDRKVKVQKAENSALVQALAERQDELRELTRAAELERLRTVEQETDLKLRLEGIKIKLCVDLADKDALIDGLQRRYDADKLKFEDRLASKDITIKELHEDFGNGNGKSNEALAASSSEIGKLRFDLSEKSTQIDMLQRALREMKQNHENAAEEIANLKNQASFPLTAIAWKAAKEIQSRDKIIENLKTELAKKTTHIRVLASAASTLKAVPFCPSLSKPRSRVHQPASYSTIPQTYDDGAEFGEAVPRTVSLDVSRTYQVRNKLVCRLIYEENEAIYTRWMSHKHS
jgi:predicted RNase H-like nuclease (RuvC/YqgF family)